MSGKGFRSWEEAVGWLIRQPGQEELVKACYFDPPLARAAERFWNSEEWRTVRGWLPRNTRGRALDVGAGNGIASYALARDGWDTFAVEPDKSELVGSGAIMKLASETGYDMHVVQEFGENLPFPENSFDIVYARQVLHHARDLFRLCGELCRVLKPGGTLVASREHVISSSAQRAKFLNMHPLHKLYGGENAFMLKQYKQALAHAGFRRVTAIGPFSSAVNYAPRTRRMLKLELTGRLGCIPYGRYIAGLLSDKSFTVFMHLLSALDRRPGRLFSFIATKPGGKI